MGEAPGETEAARGKPFVGAAGRVLDRLLAQAGIEREVCRVANVICCQPPRNWLSGAAWEHRAIAACGRFLDEELSLFKPRVVVALGNTAMRRATGQSGITRYRGYPVRGVGAFAGCWVVPTFHPSYLLPRRGAGVKDAAKNTGIVILDLRKAAEIAREGLKRTPLNYLLDPRVERAMVFAAEYEQACLHDASTTLAWDIETPGKLKAGDESEELDYESQILRISFAFSPGYAMSIPWSPEYLPVIRRLLESSGPKVGWNCYAFDEPIVGLNNIRVGGARHDGMWAWHMLQSDLPRGLEAVASHYAWELGAWKHLSDSEPARYSAIDADATIRCWLGIARDLRSREMFELYQRHVVELFRLLYEAGRVNGVEVDVNAQEAIRKKLNTRRIELMRQAQTLVPTALKPEPKVYHTKNPPEGRTCTPIPGVKVTKFCDQCGKRWTRVHPQACPMGAPSAREEPTTWWQWTVDWAELTDAQVLHAIEGKHGDDIRGFNPNSREQLLRYAQHYGHPVGTDYKTQRVQLNKKDLARLIRRFGEKHPIYAVADELREISKVVGTYLDGFEPDEKGRIYTSYTFAPSTGRLASRNVNLQNVAAGARKNRYAGLIRQTIIPGAGKVFVEADSSAIEAVMSGWFMQDPDYIRLAKLGIHDYITCLELGLEFDPARTKSYRSNPALPDPIPADWPYHKEWDAERKLFVPSRPFTWGEAYAEARERNKRVIHGTNYGMTPRMMLMQYPEAFPNERAARDAQARYFQACPRLGPWQFETRREAARNRMLRNPWGYRHYFYAVFEKSTITGELEPTGEDAKRCVAFKPQSSAAAFMRDSLLALGDSPWRACMPGNVSIHDSICLAVDADRVEEAVEFLVTLLTRPIVEMDGLRIGCEVKVGPNWGAMKAVRKELAL